MGEVNKGMLGFLIVLALGAAGYLWYSQLYQPAVAKQVAAQATLDAALQAKTAAEEQLRTAEANLKNDAARNVPPKDAIAKTSIARTAIPPDSNIGDAAIVIEKLAGMSGVRILLDIDKSQEGQSTATSDAAGAVAIDIPIEGAGSYADMVSFMDRLEGTVYDKGGKAFVNGRLFNVVKLEIAPPSEDDAGGSNSSDFGLDDFGGGGEESSGESGAGGLFYKRADVHFTITLRMYTSEASQAGAIGNETPDPAAAATDGSAIDPAAAGAGGQAPADPAAAAAANPAAANAPAAAGSAPIVTEGPAA